MIPLNDPRRRHNGNRTVRMPLSAWMRFKNDSHRHEKARAICRVPNPHEYDWEMQLPNPNRCLRDMIHHCGLGTPVEVRQRFGPIVRSLLVIIRSKRLRLASFSQHNA